MRFCKDERLAISNLQVTATAPDSSVYNAVLFLRPRQKFNKESLISHIRNTEGILHARELEDEP